MFPKKCEATHPDKPHIKCVWLAGHNGHHVSVEYKRHTASGRPMGVIVGWPTK